ncbi:MAG: hypothetical protein JXB60_09205 [Candidatus Cloacimonetes bacterium]|nr:hypothetical protein [Candidatus Cloacimonadota bacterium]
MKKYLFILIIIAIMFACDRFEHKFAPEIPEENPVFLFWADFTEAWQDITADNVDPVMAYYHENYSNNLQTKADVATFYLSLFSLADSVKFTSNLISPQPPISRNHHDITWQLQVTDALTMEVLLDSLISDVLLEMEDHLLFYGNQAVPPIYQKVLVELGTGIWCNSCPYAEEALHDLKALLGDQFYYIEYHLADALEVSGNSALLNYYDIGTLPAAVFQGQISYTGANEDIYDIYYGILQNLLNQETEVFLNDLDYSVNENMIDASVSVNLVENFPLADLNLKFTLVEEVSRINNYAGDPCLQVALYNGSVVIEAADLSVPIGFTVNLPDPPVPEDLVLYVWVQTIADEYDPEVCRIHNIIAQQIIIGS